MEEPKRKNRILVSIQEGLEKNDEDEDPEEAADEGGKTFGQEIEYHIQKLCSPAQ